jgi:hypothetical protein
MNISVYDNDDSVEENKYGSDFAHGVDAEASFIDAGLSDVSTLGDLKGIIILNLHCNKLTSISGLPILPSLMELNLSSNLFGSSDIDGLSNLPNLRILDLSGNNLSSLSSLPYMPFLERFSAAFNNIAQLDGIDGFPALIELDMRGNRLTSLTSFSGLETLSNLKELTLAGADGRNANPICANPDIVIQLFDMYYYFGAIDERHRQEWAPQKKRWATAVAAVNGPKGPKDSHVSDITPKFDAVVQKFMRRARGDDVSDEEEQVDGLAGRHVDNVIGGQQAKPFHEDGDDISDVTSVSGRRNGDTKGIGHGILKRQGTPKPDEVRKPSDNPWIDPTSPSLRSRLKASSIPASFPKPSTAAVTKSPSREGASQGPEGGNGCGDGRGEEHGDGPQSNQSDHHHMSCRSCNDMPTQTDDDDDDALETQEELVNLQHDVEALHRDMRTVVFAGTIGRTALQSTHRRELVKNYLILWRRNTSCFMLSEEKVQLLQENSLLRIASERASKTAEASKVVVENDMEYLRRALAEEKVKSETLKRQLVKQEATSQAQKKELVQTKKMCKDLEESLTSKCDEEKRSAEVQLLSVVNRRDVDMADLQRQLAEVTAERDESKDICSHLESQVKALCDQLKAAQSEPCKKCPHLEAAVSSLEDRVQAISDRNALLERDASLVSALQQKCRRYEEVDNDRSQLIDEWKAKCEAISKSLADAVGEKKRLEKQLHKVAAGYASLRTENGKLKDECEVISEEAEGSKKAVSELRAISQELKDALRKKSDKCRVLEARLRGPDGGDGGAGEGGGLHQQLQSALEQIEYLRKDREEMERALAESEAKCMADMHEVEETMKGLELSVRVKEKMIDDLNISMRRMKEKVRFFLGY